MLHAARGAAGTPVIRHSPPRLHQPRAAVRRGDMVVTLKTSSCQLPDPRAGAGTQA